jgi:fructose/tagatose bisphosphate aldolase
LGIAKFNVGTELLTAFTNELAKHFVSGNYKKDQGFDPRNYFTQAFDAVKAVVIKKLQLVGSVDKAD